MRDKHDILTDGTKREILILEVLLDIRDLLKPVEPLEIIEQLPFSEPPIEEQEAEAIVAESEPVKPKVKRKRRVKRKVKIK